MEAHLIIIGSTNKNIRAGGVPTYIYELESYLDLHNNEYTLLEISSNEYETDHKKVYADIKDHFFKRCFQLRKKIRHLKKKHGNIAFSIHYWREVIFSLDIILRHKFILNFHGPAYLEAKIEGKSKLHVWLAKKYERLTYPRATHAVCLSNEYKELLHSHYNIDKNRISVIPFGFKLNGIKDIQEPENRTFKIVCVRRLVKRVGIPLLIEACKKISDKGFNFELSIVGDGYMYDELTDLIKKIKIESKVKLLGNVTDKKLKNILLDSDLAVMPSIALEGFGISTVECLYHGVPVIGTKVGGTMSILPNLSPGLMIENPTIDGIYEKLKEILSNPDMLPSRQKCHDYAKDNYNIEKIGPKINDIFLQLQSN